MPHFLQIRRIAVAMALSPCALAFAQRDWPLQDKPAGVLPMDLVTVADPSTRHKCRVHSITAEAVTCGVGFGKKPLVYHRDNVAALILPPTHATRFATIVELSMGAAYLAGSFFVPVTALVVTLRVLAGITPFAVLSNYFDDDDHADDQLVYQRPNTPLTIHLRTH